MHTVMVGDTTLKLAVLIDADNAQSSVVTLARGNREIRYSPCEAGLRGLDWYQSKELEGRAS